MTQEDFLPPPRAYDASALLLCLQVIMLANVIVRQLWHNPSAHTGSQCQKRDCKSKDAQACGVWGNSTVQAVLEWRRVELFGLAKPAHTRVTLDVYQQALLLGGGMPLDEFAGDLDQLRENLLQLAEAAGIAPQGFGQIATQRAGALARLLTGGEK